MHVVRGGDTLAGIARRHRVRGGWEALYAANRGVIGARPGVLRIGTLLRLPPVGEEVAAPVAPPVSPAPAAGVSPPPVSPAPAVPSPSASSAAPSRVEPSVGPGPVGARA
ncbi:LysM peptidoglycan-binding domain-containing protein [Streptomyces sp. NBC_01264]|nr:LysM peptidoglycan-binding domain-containing protein [Streptomyces sp. NBC_01264]